MALGDGRVGEPRTIEYVYGCRTREPAKVLTFARAPCAFRKALGCAKDMSETLPPRRLGYARVSTYCQTLEAQLDQLCEAGCETVFREKVSGARSDRWQQQRLLGAVLLPS